MSFSMAGQELEVIYALDKISPLAAWESFYHHLIDCAVSAELQALLDGEETTLETVQNMFHDRPVENYQVDFDGVSFSYTPIIAYDHILIRIENTSSSITFDWGDLVNLFLQRAKFIQAWVSDLEYAFWQNASDLLQYEAYGRSYEGLPTKSNGLPKPMEQKEVDTSANLGRRISRQGYVEVVASHMWLGDDFWSRSGTSKKVFLAVFAEKSKFIDVDVLCLRFSGSPFNSESDNQTQQQIRDTLYTK